MYDPKSMCADDFIDHQEILDTLSYAEQHKSDAVLIDSIIEKAKERKGLSHREASVLLACDIEEKNQEIYALAEQIKKISTATASSCSHRSISPTTASTAAPTVLITQSTGRFREKS